MATCLVVLLRVDSPCLAPRHYDGPHLLGGGGGRVAQEAEVVTADEVLPGVDNI